MNRFDKEIRMLIEEEVEVPDSISPENIALMLKQSAAQKDKERRTSKISVKSKNRAITIRSAAAVAACAALAIGVTAFVNDTDDIPEITPDITQNNKASDYHDVYSIIQDTIINSPSDEGFAEIGNTKETDDVADSVATITSPESERYSIPSQTTEGVNSADIIKTDGTNLYCISDNSFYIISADGGIMEALTKIGSDDKIPVDLYVDGNKVVVISDNTTEVPYETSQETAAAESTSGVTEETTSAQVPELPQTVKQSNTIVDVYDVSNKISPVLAYSYKQNGAYISSKMVGSSLYLVTNYSNFRTKPLDSETDLDNYIPSYYLNDTKCYINAEDIILTTADSSYTIVSGLNVNENSPLVSIKALFANCKGVYCTQDSLYTIGVSGNTTTFTRFTANKGSLTFSGSNTVNGVYAGSSSVSEADGSLRAVLSTTGEDGAKSATLISFDQNMNTFATLEKVCEGQTIEIIRFNGNDVYIITAESEIPVKYNYGTEITQSVCAESDKDFVYLTKLDESHAIQIAQVDSEEGKKIRLTSLVTTDGINYTEDTTVEAEGEIPSYFTSRSLCIDAEKSIIGLPAVSSDTYGNENIYHVFSFDAEDGLSLRGSVRYTDIDPSFEFSRAFRIGDILYISSEGRIVSVQISDLKVVGTLELK